jgi:hypothetical protein
MKVTLRCLRALTLAKQILEPFEPKSYKHAFKKSRFLDVDDLDLLIQKYSHYKFMWEHNLCEKPENGKRKEKYRMTLICLPTLIRIIGFLCPYVIIST